MKSKNKGVMNRFRLDGRVVVITGGGGLLGRRHAAAIADAGGIPVLLDIRKAAVAAAVAEVARGGNKVAGYTCDITQKRSIVRVLNACVKRYGRIDGLVNNAANDPKVGAGPSGRALQRLETFPLEAWNADLAVGLTGAFLCAQVFGSYMATAGQGVILNIASDLALIGPDQRLYRQEGVPEECQPTKPVTYSAVKAGLVGLTRYLATYWASRGVRVNVICPGGVSNAQPEAFVKKLTSLIPMGRMARPDEYQAAIVFLLSDASSYMTGAVVSADGGRTAW